jgi:hypothetical protein
MFVFWRGSHSYSTEAERAMREDVWLAKASFVHGHNAKFAAGLKRCVALGLVGNALRLSVSHRTRSTRSHS